jgi:hypothetical protein
MFFEPPERAALFFVFTLSIPISMPWFLNDWSHPRAAPINLNQYFFAKNRDRKSPTCLFFESDYFPPLVRTADRTDPVRLLGAMALRAGVDGRSSQAVMSPSLIPPRF